MIALLAATAVAAPRVDVLYDYQWARTTPIRVRSEDTMSGPVPIAPRRTALDSGIAAELFWGEDDLYVLSFGLRGYDAEHRLAGYVFEPRVWDARVDFGGHAWFAYRGEPRIDGYLIGAAGVQTSWLRVEPWPTTIAPALHGLGGIGLATRRGRVHLRAEARLSLAMRVDYFEGRAELPEETLVWHYHPGSATVSLLFGLGLSAAGGEG